MQEISVERCKTDDGFVQKPVKFVFVATFEKKYKSRAFAKIITYVYIGIKTILIHNISGVDDVAFLK